MSRRNNFTIISNAVIDRIAELGKPAVFTYMLLARHADEHGYCWPGLTRLSALGNMRRHTIIDGIKTLEDAGLVTVQRTFGKPNRYTLKTLPTSDKRDTGTHSGSDKRDTGTSDKRDTGTSDKRDTLTRPSEQNPVNKTKKGRTPGRSKKSSSPPGGGAAVTIPENLDTPEFTAAWREWLSYRRERRLTCTERTLEGQLRKLATLPPPAAVAEIENSIANGWQSLCYGDRHHGNGKPKPQNRAGRVEAEPGKYDRFD